VTSYIVTGKDLAFGVPTGCAGAKSTKLRTSVLYSWYQLGTRRGQTKKKEEQEQEKEKERKKKKEKKIRI
jgi:hypothetical protein